MNNVAKPPIITRPQPIFGVCEALGDDFGVNANWLRAALGPLMLWNPLATVAGYLTLAVLVMAVRFAFPDVTVPAAVFEDDARLPRPAALIEDREERLAA